MPQNFDQAFSWFEKAAKNGDSDAQYVIGLMYYQADGVKQDLEKAFEWFRKSAKQGNGLAKEILINNNEL
ncbi:tetratricopeptide repeat protein [Neisseria sp. Ec49-e6-T10]|uniref:tetratricopeptide repeat protein n=1 Tax=Neisseria sp. Ec49-e6-T10 TaxID=3140744 RepID=UPI003EC10488